MQLEIEIGGLIVLVLGFGALLLRAVWWKMLPLAGVIVALLAIVDVSMGRPVPLDMARFVPSGRLIGFTARSGQAIYVWVLPPDKAPVAVMLPWNETAYDQLSAAESKKCTGKGYGVSFSRHSVDEHDPPLTVTEVEQHQPPAKD